MVGLSTVCRVVSLLANPAGNLQLCGFVKETKKHMQVLRLMLDWQAAPDSLVTPLYLPQMYQSTDQNHRPVTGTNTQHSTLHVKSLDPMACRQCPLSGMASSLTRLTPNLCEARLKRGAVKKNASGMHTANKIKKGKEACYLIHNITPRLSMQIHLTLQAYNIHDLEDVGKTA